MADKEITNLSTPVRRFCRDCRTRLGTVAGVEVAVEIPAGALERLIEHYGPGARSWLTGVSETFAAASARWRVRLSGIHDAGWTSVVAHGVDTGGRGLVIKASPDRQRYLRERFALDHWWGSSAARLIDFDDAAQLLLLELVAGVPGGGERPADQQHRVAGALSRLHDRPADTRVVPSLVSHYRGEVAPRVRHRAAQLGSLVGRRRVERCLELVDVLCARPARDRLLHADLYAENVLFDQDGDPVFIDPHPKVGSPAFDWAFWCVYYVQTGGFEDRVALCEEYAPSEVEEALAWSVTLAVDGALYFFDRGEEENAAAMLAVLAAKPLARSGILTVGYPLR